MTGLFPSNGVPPGSTTNGIANPVIAAGCENQYYPPRCNPRMDPFAMNALISELINLMNRLGRSYDCNENTNLAETFLSMAAGQLTYGVSTGTANARVLALPPLFAEIGLVPGMEITFKSHATNTNAMTIDVDGIGAKAIVSASGNPMAPGDISTGDMVPLLYDGTRWIAYTKVTVVVPEAPPSLGVGQVWQDVLSSRAVGTTYQNTTGKPIAVSVMSQDADGAARWFEVSANGSTFVIIGNGTFSSGSEEYLTLSSGGPFVIPDDHYYRVRGAGGISLQAWSELR